MSAAPAGNALPKRVKYAHAHGKNATKWVTREATLDEFLTFLNLDNPAAVKDCTGYVLGELNGTRRAKGTVAARYGVTLDVDDSTPDQVQTFLDRVRGMGVWAVVHTTYRHTEAAPRCRVILLYSRPVTPDEHRTLTRALMADFGIAFDETCAQPERFMYVPAAADRAAYEHEVIDGAPLDVDAWLDRAEVDDLAAEVTHPVSAPSAAPDFEALPDPAYVERTISGVADELDALAAEAEGGRDERDRGWDKGVFALACRLVRAANAGTAYTLADAERDFMAHAPAAEGTYDPAHKWASAVRTVNGGTLSPSAATAGATERLTDGAKGDSWQRVDLGDVIAAIEAGTLTRLAPVVGQLEGGSALFYPGKVNGIAGDSNAGKSFTAMLAAKQEMEAGNHVIYIDYEDDAAAVALRFLNDLRAAPSVLREQLVYLNPREALTEEGRAHLRQTLENYRPTLAVIDSTGESMSTEGVKPNEDDETALWFQRLPRWIAERGPAVVVIDHQTKADGGLWPIGSQRKRAAINGAQYVQATVTPFDQWTSGGSKIVCAKDRLGTYATGKTVAEFRVDVNADERFTLHAVGGPAGAVDGDPRGLSSRAAAEEKLMEAISQWLAELPPNHDGASRSTLQREVSHKVPNDDGTVPGAARVKRATDRLAELGYVDQWEDGQTTRHLSRKRYYATAASDDFYDASGEDES